MARIRSVHPGLFTDEAFAQLSDAAQIFWIGLWTEADDHGVFEWKPVTLKMRLRPASVFPVEPLLEELEALECVKRFAIAGKQYGAVRNFCRFQRPKKPTFVHPVPSEFRTYLGLIGPGGELPLNEPDGGSEPEPRETEQIPRNGELPPQMEEGIGGGRGVPSLRSGIAKPEKNGTRLPPDWNPGERGAEFARTCGVNPSAEFAKFKDYWLALAGQKARKVDWDATWRNWCRNNGTPRRSGVAATPLDPATGRELPLMSGGFD